jgi:hypothetical protein
MREKTASTVVTAATLPGPLVQCGHQRRGGSGAQEADEEALGCALFFPDRKEELEPELWADAQPAGAE